MIHTFEIYYELNYRSAAYCVGNLNRIAREYGPVNGRPRYFSDTKINEYLTGDRKSLRFSTEFLFLGLHHIKFTKMPLPDGRATYYIYFRIEPEVLLTQEYSLNLFQCNENNFDALQSRYGEIVYQIFPRSMEQRPIEGSIDFMPVAERRYIRDLEYRIKYGELAGEELEIYRFRHLFSLPYLGLARIARVDFTVDFRCDHPDIYLRLAKQSYVDNASRKRKLYLKKGKYLAAYNKTVDGFLIYDKQKKYMLPRFDNKPNIEELRRAAANVMRIEYVFKCRSRREQLRFTRLNHPAKGQTEYESTPGLCGLMPYIIQDVGAERLRNEYYRLIGGGQWMSDYHWNNTMEQSSLTKTMKRKLNNLAYLISEVRHLDRSKAAFAQGRDIQRYRGPGTLHVQGSKDMFRTHIDKIRSLGLQPLRIPETDFFKDNGRQVTHVSSDFDNFTRVDLGVEHHEIIEWAAEDGDIIPVYESTVADLKALYNRYRLR